MLALFVLNFAAAVVANAVPGAATDRLAELFLMDREKNLPTIFNYGLILMNAVLLAIIAFRALSAGDRWRWHWVLLCAIFAFLSYDEAAQVHERFVGLGRMLVEGKGLFRYTWIVPVAPMVVLVGLLFLNFVRSQAPAVRRLFVLSGGLFLFGAIGVEMLSGAYVDIYDSTKGSVPYHTISGVEECLEMIGMALFGYTLLRILGVTREAGARN